MTRYGYAEPPPAKQHKPNVVADVSPAVFNDDDKSRVMNIDDCPGVASETRQKSRQSDSSTDVADPTFGDAREGENMDVASHGQPSVRQPSSKTSLVDLPKSPQCPVLQSLNIPPAVVDSHVDTNRPPNANVAFGASTTMTTTTRKDVEMEDDVEDESILAMELPPTPVCPQMTWLCDETTSAAAAVGDHQKSASTLTAMTAPPLPHLHPPRTPASAMTLPMAHTPTPPILLSAAKKTLDVTKIDFSGLEDGEVFHTGLTPKTPELHVSTS